MTATLRWFSRGGFALAAASLLLSTSGCSSDPGPGQPPPPKASKWKPPPPLSGQELFFDGKVLVTLDVGAGAPGAPGGPGEGGPPGGGGGHGGGHRMRGGGGGFGGPPPGGGPDGPGGPGGMPPGGDPEAAQAMATRRAAMGSGHPPVMIHLKLTNQGTERLEVRVPDFLSPLGNFVIEPEKLALEPGQSLEVEPMTSRLAGEIGETTVTLTLHIPGHTEKKTITLRTVAPPAPPPAADDQRPKS